MPRKKVVPGEASPPGGGIAEPAAKVVKPRGSAVRSTTSAAQGSGRKLASKTSIRPPDAAQAAQGGSGRILDATVSVHEQIAFLAYSYWESRGRQGGSPEEDWYRAEQEIRGRHRKTSGPQ
jgi:hypothetical protein